MNTKILKNPTVISVGLCVSYDWAVFQISLSKI
jgi:hypothetical protein